MSDRYQPGPRPPSSMPILANAFRDFTAATQQWRLWLTLAHEDIVDQHRYTLLGPLWLLLNYVLFVGTLILIFGTFGHQVSFVAYMALGLLVWLFISDIITQAPGLFFKEAGLVKGTALPLPIYVFRMTAQLLFRTSYAAVACIAMTLFAGVPITAFWLLAGCGIILIVASTPAAIMVLAMAGVMFPDLRFVAGHLTRLGFFLTPIFWLPTYTGFRGVLYAWNPFTYYLDIVRTPVLTASFPMRSFLVTVIFAIVLWAVALLLLGLFRKRVVFWL